VILISKHTPKGGISGECIMPDRQTDGPSMANESCAETCAPWNQAMSLLTIAATGICCRIIFWDLSIAHSRASFQPCATYLDALHSNEQSCKSRVPHPHPRGTKQNRVARNNSSPLRQEVTCPCSTSFHHRSILTALSTVSFQGLQGATPVPPKKTAPPLLALLPSNIVVEIDGPQLAVMARAPPTPVAELPSNTQPSITKESLETASRECGRSRAKRRPDWSL
jgi:hypothetical protein